jgi:Ca2+-binding EF-hand superfamily protein
MEKVYNSEEFHSITEGDNENIDEESGSYIVQEEEEEDIEIADENSIKNLKYNQNYLNKSQEEDNHSQTFQNLSPSNKNRIREIISYLKGQKTGLRVSEINKIFEKLDLDGDNKIDAEEIKKFLSTLRTPINDYFIQKLIKEFDINNDGEIQKKEFLERMGSQKDTGYGNELTELLEVFKLFDANQDNKICINDLQNVMNALGENFEDETVKDMMKYLSSGNDFIDFSRFFDLVKEEGKNDIFY